MFLGRISFILPQTWLVGEKGDFGTVWDIAVSRGGTVMELLGAQLENLVVQDKAVTLWWDRTWQECHRSCPKHGDESPRSLLALQVCFDWR